MGVAKQRIDETYLSQFTPLSTLSPELLDEALDHATIERYPPGRRIIQEGAPRQDTLFLLSGQLALMSDGSPARTLKADSREAARPIDEHHAPRCTALASTSVTILSIDSTTLEELLRRNEGRGVKPSPHGTDPGPEGRLQGALTAPLFSRLPKPHLQVLKKRLTAMEVNAGDIIVHEGDPSEYYYLIVTGRCRVTRQPGRNSRQITVAELTAGEGFGEGALIAQDFHDSTVTMLENGRLLRLSKGEFLTLLVRPFIKWIPYQRLLEMKARGAIPLDIRSAGVFQKRHLQDSINIPLRTLRHCAFLLDKRKTYIICGDIGRRAASAAFLLAQQGMDVKILDESMRSALRKDDKAAKDPGPQPKD